MLRLDKSFMQGVLWVEYVVRCCMIYWLIIVRKCFDTVVEHWEGHPASRNCCSYFILGFFATDREKKMMELIIH